MTSASSMQEAGDSKLVLWDNPEGWDGEGGQRGVQDEGTRVHPSLFMSMCGKHHHNIVIILQLKKNLDSVLKSRDITLLTKVCIIKAMVFPVVMYRCDNWTIKRLSTEELMPSNCGVEEDSCESLVQQRDPTSQS